MSDGMRRELVYLSSYATNRYFIPNWGYIYNQYAQEFFRAQYEADNDEAAACRRYAEKTDGSTSGRWDKDFCRTFGLGYSPARGNKFLQYAKDKGLNLQILVEIGLLGDDDSRPGNYYDFYRGRLMIPQRDRYGRVQTFTARSISIDIEKLLLLMKFVSENSENYSLSWQCTRLNVKELDKKDIKIPQFGIK